MKKEFLEEVLGLLYSGWVLVRDGDGDVVIESAGNYNASNSLSLADMDFWESYLEDFRPTETDKDGDVVTDSDIELVDVYNNADKDVKEAMLDAVESAVYAGLEEY